MSLLDLSSQQLRQAADLQEKIQRLQNQLDQLLAGQSPAPAPVATAAPEAAAQPANGRRKRKPLSPQGLANIRAGVAKRQARKAGKQVAAGSALMEPAGEPKRKRKISAAGKAAIAAAAKARWAKFRAEKKKRAKADLDVPF